MPYTAPPTPAPTLRIITPADDGSYTILRDVRKDWIVNYGLMPAFLAEARALRDEAGLLIGVMDNEHNVFLPF